MSHAEAATAFNQDPARVAWHDQALWFVRQKRDRAVAEVPEWEALRDLAAQIKAHTLSHLDEYLLQFEKQATRNGIAVHWATDAEAHNRIVYDLLRAHGVRTLVKSKSMLTEECHLNPYLEARGIDVVDTDLGERIVQLRREPPSHLVLPAIHLKKEEVGTLFHEQLGTEAGMSDPAQLAEAARQHLRMAFLTADAALTGINFAIAETGGLVVCTNEGNADLGVHLAPLHIASMGIEKVIPRLDDLGVFLRLLARSATGQPITAYTSFFHTPRPGAALHVVLVDNGRTTQRDRAEFRRSLHCIRCGACLNTCPVYRRSGGHSYGAVVPGPIGAILSPGFDLARHRTLPFASTLCGSCTDVCPVKIDLHEQLYRWRQVVAETGHLEAEKRRGMQVLGWVLASPTRYAGVGRLVRGLLRWLPGSVARAFRAWTRHRALPEPPAESFQTWYRRTRTP
jgi:L-lactate dehydrogenase complex protein LldF